MAAIRASGLLDALADFQPIVVSTILVGLDIDGSDIDVACCYADRDTFAASTDRFVRGFANASCDARSDHVVARFDFHEFQFEIYGSPIPIDEQFGVRHFRVMQRLVDIGGLPFQDQVRRLKQQGLKTEPAIAAVLQLEGDPYMAVAELDRLADDELVLLLQRA